MGGGWRGCRKMEVTSRSIFSPANRERVGARLTWRRGVPAPAAILLCRECDYRPSSRSVFDAFHQIVRCVIKSPHLRQQVDDVARRLRESIVDQHENLVGAEEDLREAVA